MSPKLKLKVSGAMGAIRYSVLHFDAVSVFQHYKVVLYENEDESVSKANFISFIANVSWNFKRTITRL